MASSDGHDMKEVVVAPSEKTPVVQPPPYESPSPDVRSSMAPEAVHGASGSSPHQGTQYTAYQQHPALAKEASPVSPQTSGASAFGGTRQPVSPQQTGGGFPHDPLSFGQPQQTPPAAQYPTGYNQQPHSPQPAPAQPAPAHTSTASQGQQQHQGYQAQTPMQELKPGGQPQYRNTVALHSLTSAAAPVQCPSCGAVALTHTEIIVGMFTHAVALGVCFFTCLGCIPYCISGFKDVEHKCSNCGARLALWHRSGRTEVFMYHRT